MSFIDKFIYHSSGNECPAAFLEWSALSLINHVAGRKIWTMHGNEFSVDPKLYVCLVGTPGSGKSTAMAKAEDLFLHCFPTRFISESIQSREDILRKMTNDQCLCTAKDADGKIHEWRPFYCLVDEMENFLSVDDKKMVGMLVGIYSRSSFGTGFKNDTNPNQRILHPYMSLLACTIPEWMMSSLRMSLFVGGLGRRMIIVHARKTKNIPNPYMPANHEKIWAELAEHLLIIDSHVGELKRSPEANKWWVNWFNDGKRKHREDPILIQFHETQHIQMLKVAIGLALSEDPRALVIEVRHLERAYTMIKALENDIVRLTQGIGRNELAGVGAQMLDLLERVGGAMPEVQLRKFFNRYMRDPEFVEQINHYVQTGQLEIKEKTINGDTRRYYFLPGAYERLTAATLAEIQQRVRASSPSLEAGQGGAVSAG